MGEICDEILLLLDAGLQFLYLLLNGTGHIVERYCQIADFIQGSHFCPAGIVSSRNDFGKAFEPCQRFGKKICD